MCGWSLLSVVQQCLDIYNSRLGMLQKAGHLHMRLHIQCSFSKPFSGEPTATSRRRPVWAAGARAGCPACPTATRSVPAMQILSSSGRCWGMQ